MISKLKEKKKKIKRKKNSRRKNAIWYPVYKVFAWDLLCYYSMEYLFLTITKGITASQVLIVAASYTISKVILQIPAIITSEYLGKKKSIILANVLVLLSVIFLMISPNLLFVCIAQIVSAMGYNIKAICDSNLLYDSVATKGGDGLYTKLETKGASGYYIVDAILSMMAGYLFVINNYIPMIICCVCLVISIIISIKFKNIYEVKKEERKSIAKFTKEYKTDIIQSLKFIKKSKRIKAYLIFASVFYAIIRIMDSYKSTLLTESGIGAEQYSIIIASLSLIAAVSVGFAKTIQNKFKNRTLSVISIIYCVAWVIAGFVSIKVTSDIGIAIILALYCVHKICNSQWYIVRGKYLKNFTEPQTREKITFTFELITSLAGGLSALIGAAILSVTDIKHAILLVSLAGLALIIVILDYMRSRFGLKPKDYSEDDLKFE